MMRKFLGHACIFAEARYSVVVTNIEWAIFELLRIVIRPLKAEISMPV